MTLCAPRHRSLGRIRRGPVKPALKASSARARSAHDLPHVERTGPGADALLLRQLMDLQRVAGNSAVRQLLQRQPKPNPGPTTGGPTTTPMPAKPGMATATPDPAKEPDKPDPLADTRIKWIDELPTQIRASIDSSSAVVEKRVRKIEEDISKQRAVLDAASADPTKKLPDDGAIKKLKADRLKVTKSWAPNRLALMDYLGCTLGGDVGVERYYKSLVQFGTRELWVHPEAARRLIRVRDELAKEKVPMPETDNGFAMRGRHIHPTKQDQHPGMMTHSLGVAIDWEAYKNVHILDEQLMHLITAVTGRAHNIQLPADAMSSIVALGEQSMGNKLTDKQAKQVAKGADLIDTVGKEFDRLEADSDMFRDSLKKDDIVQLHRQINPVIEPLEEAEKAVGAAQSSLARAQARKGKDKDKKVAAAAKVLADAKDELAKRQTDHDKKMADNKAKLEELFKPWLDALKKAQEATTKEAEPLLKGKRLDAVLTDAGLKSKVAGVAGGTAGVAKELSALDKDTNGTIKKVQAIRTTMAGARAHLAKAGSEQEKSDWTARLEKLEERAALVVGRGTAVTTESSVLRGRTASTVATAPTAKVRKTKWDKDVPAWEAEVANKEAAMGTSEATLKAAIDKVPKEAVAEAHKLRDERAASEEIRNLVGKENFAKLQGLKAKMWHLERASYRMLNDASFMFQKATVRNPGAAQLTGTLDVNSKGKKAYLGGGGFFGTPTRDKESAAKVAAEGKGKASTQSGFAKRFFQTMVKYGFEPAAHWRTADSMHFQVRGLVESIVPADACKEPPVGAEETTKEAMAKAKTDKEKGKLAADLAAITEAREKAVAERAAGEAYSTKAAAAKTTWAAEGGNR